MKLHQSVLSDGWADAARAREEKLQTPNSNPEGFRGKLQRSLKHQARIPAGGSGRRLVWKGDRLGCGFIIIPEVSRVRIERPGRSAPANWGPFYLEEGRLRTAKRRRAGVAAKEYTKVTEEGKTIGAKSWLRNRDWELALRASAVVLITATWLPTWRNWQTR